MHGTSVSYQPPIIFDAAYVAMTSHCKSDGLGRDYYKVFIDGGSGSGKTRMGWELYRRFARQVADGNSKVRKVHYVSILQGPGEPMFKALREGSQWRDSEKWAYYEKLLADHIVSKMTKEKPPNNEASLRDVLHHLLGLQKGERGTVVLHIDEFHRTPQVTKDLLSTVRHFSELNADSGMVILPVCTGLYTDPSFDMKDSSPGFEKLFHLSYLPSDQATWDLVKAAATAASGGYPHPIFAASLLKDCDADPLRYLVEDLRGWPFAAVMLGAALTTALKFSEMRWMTFYLAEEQVYRSLRSMYDIPTLRKMLGHSEAALLKLALLVLSPFTVCFWCIGRQAPRRSAFAWDDGVLKRGSSVATRAEKGNTRRGLGRQGGGTEGREENGAEKTRVSGEYPCM